jgi:hypothetical protein
VADYIVTPNGRKYLVSKAQREAGAAADHAAQQQRLERGTERRTMRELFPELYQDEQPQPCYNVARSWS